MDQDVADAIADLKRRIKRQETTHEDVVETDEGGEDSTGLWHGTVSNIPVMIMAVLLAASISLLVASRISRVQ